MDRDPQIESLVATPATVEPGKTAAQPVQDGVPVADTLALDHRSCVLECLADFFPAGHLTHAGMAGVVAQHDQIAGEERPVGAAQVEQHAVVPGDRYHAHLHDARQSEACMGVGFGAWVHACPKGVG